MATRRRSLFLYLALACFIGIIAIFIVDGYLGVYDALYITAGEREETIEPDFWQREDWVWSTGVNQGERVFFRYEVDNRQFSRYSGNVEVSVWRMQERVLSLASQSMAIAPFDEGEIEWIIDTTELKPGDILPEQSYQFSVIIARGAIERKVILHVNPLTLPKPPVRVS